MSQGRGVNGVLIRDLRWEDVWDIVQLYMERYCEVERNSSLGLVMHRERPQVHEELEWFVSAFNSTLKGDMVFKVADHDGKVVGSCSVERYRPGTESSHRGILGVAVKE